MIRLVNVPNRFRKLALRKGDLYKFLAANIAKDFVQIQPYLLMQTQFPPRVPQNDDYKNIPFYWLNVNASLGKFKTAWATGAVRFPCFCCGGRLLGACFNR